MTTQSFTPGPWSADAHIPRGSADAEYRIHAGRYLVAIVNDIDPAETEANARLIAAAPDMADALAKIAEALDDIIDCAPSDAPTAGFAHLATSVRAVLARATLQEWVS